MELTYGQRHVCNGWIDGKTNHSLRATGASEMFRAGVPEKIVQECTGHRTVKALRMYERTSASQHSAVSNILLTPNKEEAKSCATSSSSVCHSGLGSLTSIFGTTSHCVINVNFGERNATMTKDCGYSASIPKSCANGDT